jgi:hypothetical protein
MAAASLRAQLSGGMNAALFIFMTESLCSGRAARGPGNLGTEADHDTLPGQCTCATGPTGRSLAESESCLGNLKRSHAATGLVVLLIWIIMSHSSGYESRAWSQCAYFGVAAYHF